jgi:hypothetical protein
MPLEPWFRDDKDEKFIPLQAADLIAGEMRLATVGDEFDWMSKRFDMGTLPILRVNSASGSRESAGASSGALSSSFELGRSFYRTFAAIPFPSGRYR